MTKAVRFRYNLYMLSFFQRNKKGVVQVIKALVYLSFLAPLVVSARHLFPFVFPKAVFLEFLVELALVLYLGLALANKEFLPKLNWLIKSVIFWIATILVAGLAGVNFYSSFWSRAERMEGIFWYLHLLAFFLILVSLFKTAQDWKNKYQQSCFLHPPL